MTKNWAIELNNLPYGSSYKYKILKKTATFLDICCEVRMVLTVVTTSVYTARQVDYTNVFAQADINEESDILK